MEISLIIALINVILDVGYFKYMFNLNGTPYHLDDASSSHIRSRINSIEERVMLLRHAGTLTERTIKDYYGEKRFEQVAESNAIEGSTLSVGETELAVLKGVTITGHDPAFVRDAIALDRALTRISEIARQREIPTNIQQLHEIHSLILGERPGAGIFRKERVLIRGAKHHPPKTWDEIIKLMKQWETWSSSNSNLPAPIRSLILHAWLTHIHPYIDGNGRTARAIGNLELIRAGYPPIIIKKKERDRYIESLAESDEGGDIRSFADLVLEKIEGALRGLELSAKRKQGIDPIIEKIRIHQEKQLKIWITSVQLLATIIEHKVSQQLEGVGTCSIKIFDNSLDLEDYIEVCDGRSVARSWAFILRIDLPGVSCLEKLAYIGHRSTQMFNHLNNQGGPALYWSSKNPNGFPKWLPGNSNSPYAVEMTTHPGNGDEWFVRLATSDSILTVATTELAERLAAALVSQAIPE